MIINIKAVKIDLTPSIKEYIETKIGSVDKFLKKFEPLKNPPAGDSAKRSKKEIEVFLEIARTTSHHHKGDVFRVAANIPIGKTVIRAEDIDWDARIAVDRVKDKLQQEIKKYKGLSQNFRASRQ